jgi:CheY-like chemotaxis protein
VNILSDEDYHIIPLQSGLAAVNYIKKNGAPDLLIMDIEMPRMDGVKTVASIRNMGHTDLPVIFLTAKNNRETVLRCREVNAKDYIIKPVIPAYLKTRVAVALDASLER